MANENNDFAYSGVTPAASAGGVLVIPHSDASGDPTLYSFEAPPATTSTPGVVKPDGTTISIDPTTHVISAVGIVGGGGGGSLPFTVMQETQVTSGPSNVTSFVVAFPQALAASGNTAFLLIACDGSSTVTIPSGWTLDFNQQQSTYARLILCHKTTAGETSATVTCGASSSFAVFFFELAGSHALDQASTAGIGNVFAIQTNAITPTANSLVFSVAALVSGGTVVVSAPVFSGQWRTIGFGAPVVGGRALVGLISTIPATNVSTTPPAILIPQVSLYPTGNIACATFSIL